MDEKVEMRTWEKSRMRTGRVRRVDVGVSESERVANRGTQETGRENLDFMCETMQLIDYALDTGVS